MIRLNVNLVRGIQKNIKNKPFCNNEEIRNEIKPYVKVQRRRYNKSFQISMNTLQKRRYTKQRPNDDISDEEFINTLPPELFVFLKDFLLFL